jgi:hypothetical protein
MFVISSNGYSKNLIPSVRSRIDSESPAQKRGPCKELTALFFIFLVVGFSQDASRCQTLDSPVDGSLRISLAHLEKSVAEIHDTSLYRTYGTQQLA